MNPPMRSDQTQERLLHAQPQLQPRQRRQRRQHQVDESRRSHTSVAPRQQQQADVSQLDAGMGGGGGSETKRQRENLPRTAVHLMQHWLYQHVAHPYPSEPEKQSMAQVG